LIVVNILASKLRRTPNLRYNPDRPASSFTPWLRAVARSHCQDAIRGLRSYSARQLPLLSDPLEKLSTVDQRIDLHMLCTSARERAGLSLLAQSCRKRYPPIGRTFELFFPAGRITLLNAGRK
jgi:DNA-directed RNA polymerase specialized sigma24 family protein